MASVWDPLHHGLHWLREGPPSHARIPSLVCPSVRAWIVRRGSAEIGFQTAGRGGVLRLGPGEGAFLPRQALSHRFGRGTVLRSLACALWWDDGGEVLAAERPLLLAPPAVQELDAELDRLFHIIGGPLQEPGLTALRIDVVQRCRLDAAWASALTVVMAGALAAGASVAPRQPPDAATRRLRRALDLWPLEQRLRLEQLAGQVGLPPRRCQVLARRHLGSTPEGWIERRRVDLVRQLLQEGRDNMHSIALRIGVRPGNFAAWTRRRLGCTARDWRLGKALTC